jgi:hypothetical protein
MRGTSEEYKHLTLLIWHVDFNCESLDCQLVYKRHSKVNSFHYSDVQWHTSSSQGARETQAFS